MQSHLQSKIQNKTQIISLVLVSISILVGFFFTIDQGYSYMANKDAFESSKKEVIEKKGTLQHLQDMTKNVEQDTALLSDIERYAGNFREDIIFDNLFALINGISIANISLSPGEKSPNGLSLANISLSIKAQDMNALTNYLNYLTRSTIGKKSYIIKNLSFPLDTTKNEPIAASLEISMYYFK